MKKLLALILALTMVFALAACGSEPAANSDAPSGDDVPSGEAVELTRKYEDEDVVAFVNGILGSFARDLEKRNVSGD